MHHTPQDAGLSVMTGGTPSDSPEDNTIKVVRVRPEVLLLETMIGIDQELSAYVSAARRPSDAMGFRSARSSSIEIEGLVSSCERASLICESIFGQHHLANEQWIAIRGFANQVQAEVDQFLALLYSKTDGVSVGESNREFVLALSMGLKQALRAPILQLQGAFAQAAAPQKGKHK